MFCDNIYLSQKYFKLDKFQSFAEFGILCRKLSSVPTPELSAGSEI